MDENELKYVVEAALLAAGRPLSVDKLVQLFAEKRVEVERATIRNLLDALNVDYQGRGLQVKEVASGYRIQVRASMHDWLQPLWEERAPRYTRALLETLALVAYRQPITRAEIEEVRGVAVSTNIVRTLMERGWVRVVGYRDVPGKPSMLGTTREFLDYFGLKKLEELPALADIKDGYPELSPQSDFLDSLEIGDMAEVEIPVAEDLESTEPEATGVHRLGAPVLATTALQADDNEVQPAEADTTAEPVEAAEAVVIDIDAGQPRSQSESS